MKMTMKKRGFLATLLGKGLLVVLFVLSLLGTCLSGVWLALCMEYGFYSRTLPEVRQTRMEELCREDMHEAYIDAFLPLFEMGMLTEEHSAFEEEHLFEEYLGGFDAAESNFFFRVQAEDGTVLLETDTAPAQCEVTVSFQQEQFQDRMIRMTAAEYEQFQMTNGQYVIAVNEVVSESVDGTEMETDAQDVPCYEVTVRDRTTMRHFYVTGYVREVLQADDHYLLVQNSYGMLYQYRYLPLLLGVVSLILVVTSMVLLLQHAGLRKGRTDVVSRWTDRIPLEILTLFAGSGILSLLVLAAELWNEIGNHYSTAVLLPCYALLLVGMALCLLFWLMSLVVRIRTGTFCRYTLAAMVVQGGRRLFQMLQQASTVLPVLWHAVLAAAAYFTLQVIAVVFIGNGEFIGVLLMLLLWAAGFLMVGVVTWNLHLLEQGAKELAAGNLQYQIAEEKLIGPFRMHARRLNQLQEGMHRAVSERMKSERFKTELIANVSHDIRTPLTSIMNYTDLLAKLNLAHPEAKEYIAVLQRQSVRLQKLTEDVLEASKASTGNLTVHAEEMDLRILLEQVLGEYAEKLEAKQLSVISQIPEEPLYLMADGRLLWRVMENLMTNICKYAMPHTRVYLDVTVEEQQLHLVLRNISRTQLHLPAEALLERFVQGDRSRHTEGSGLGLSIAQSLTELQGGRFQIEIDGDLFKAELVFPKI